MRLACIQGNQHFKERKNYWGFSGFLLLALFKTFSRVETMFLLYQKELVQSVSTYFRGVFLL